MSTEKESTRQRIKGKQTTCIMTRQGGKGEIANTKKTVSFENGKMNGSTG